MSTNALYLGKTLGIMGIDRNGQRLIMNAKDAGLNVGVYLDHPEPETTKLADFTIIGNYRDKDKLTEFGENCDVILYETPAIDSVVLRYLNKYSTISQGIEPLEIMQDRLMERAFLDQVNVNLAPYVTVISLDDIYQSIDSIGYPAVLRPIQRGLREKSLMIRKQSDIARAADFIQGGTYLLESWIEHAAEYSIVMAVDSDGVSQYPLIEQEFNDNRQLVAAKAPATVPDDMYQEMKRIADSIGSQLGYHGILAVDFYVTSTDNLYIKDIQPGLSTAGNVFSMATNISQEAQEIRIASGQPIHFIKSIQPVIFLVGRQKQLAALERQELIRNNWKISFFNPQRKDDEAVCAYVWASSPDDNLDELQNQIDDTEVWVPMSSADDNVDENEPLEDEQSLGGEASDDSMPLPPRPDDADLGDHAE